MGELGDGMEQAVSTPSEAGSVQAGTQTGEGATGPVENGTSGVDAVRAEEYKRLQGEYTRATQELSAYRKLNMSADEIRAAIDQQRSGQSAADVIKSLLEEQAKGKGPDLSSNVYLQDPDARAAFEYLAEQKVKPAQEKLTAQEQRISALLSNMVQETVGKAAASFLDSHKEYGLTSDQLKTAAMELGPALKMKPDDPKLMALAAVHASGGLDAITDKAGAAKVQAYIEQSKSNGRVGTTVQSGAPATVAPTPPKSLKDPKFKASMVGLLEALDASKK